MTSTCDGREVDGAENDERRADVLDDLALARVSLDAGRRLPFLQVVTPQVVCTENAAW